MKYLPTFGWKPFVLTVRDVNTHVYDYGLLSEIPEEAEIIRTESLDPQRLSAFFFPVPPHSKESPETMRNPNFTEGSWIIDVYRKLRDWFAFPDSRVGWIPYAFRQGLKIIRNHKIDVIVGSVGPYTSAILSKMLSRRTGIPYVIDFRDGWTDYPYLIRPTYFHNWAHISLERSVVENANGVLVYGEFLRQRLVRRYPKLIDRIEVLTNGFDPSDCEGVTPAPKREGWRRIVYMGSLYKIYEPHFKSVLAALQLLSKDILRNLEIVFVGRVEFPDAQARISAAGLENHLKLIGYIPHRDALSYLLSADACLLLLPVGDIQAYSGKIFEYFMVRRPIIACIEPESTAAALLQRVGQADWIVPPASPPHLCEVITRLANTRWPRPEVSGIEQFNRKRLTEKLSAFLNATIKRSRMAAIK